MAKSHQKDFQVRFRDVSEPVSYRVSDVVSERAKISQCKICTHEYRDAIEILALSGLSFKQTSDYIKREYGINVSHDSVRRHMLNHTSLERGQSASILISEADDPDEQLLSPRGVAKLLAAQVLTKLVRGDLEVNSMTEAIRILTLQETARNNDLAQDISAVGQSVEEAYRQLGYIMTALRDTVPERFLEAAVKKAWSLGLGEEISSLAEVPIYQLEAMPEVDMSRAIEDYKTKGRSSTREELEDEGYFEGAVPPDEDE
jgi:hypothetical protein